MKKKQIEPQLPPEYLKRLLPVSLPLEATAEDTLAAIEHFIPTLRNLPENLIVMRHLDIREKDITNVLTGGSAYIQGELQSLAHPSVKVIITYGSISLKELDGKNQVQIDGIPFESFIRRERKRQEELSNEMSSKTKEDLHKEISALRRQIKRVSNEIKAYHDINDKLLDLCDIYKNKLKNTAQNTP